MRRSSEQQRVMRWWWVVTLALAVGAQLATGCSASTTVYEVSVPAGTWRDRTTEVLAALPQRTEADGATVLEFSVGDTLVVENNDSVEHVIGLVSVRPGETVRHVFRRAGVFEGSCTLLTGEQVTIEIRP